MRHIVARQKAAPCFGAAFCGVG